MADDPDMLDAFQDWMRKRGGLGAGSMPERVFFAGWLAARRTAPSSPVADDGLPPLPSQHVPMVGWTLTQAYQQGWRDARAAPPTAPKPPKENS